MGTSGAFGGSDTEKWRKVKQRLESTCGEGDDVEPGGDPDDGRGDPEAETVAAPSPVADLVADIAKALQADDPAIRPRFAPIRTDADSGLFFGAMAGTRSRGSAVSPPSGGRRRVAQGASRGGAAVGAGHALATGNAEALHEYGLDLASLQGMSRPEQILAILDACSSETSAPDDVVLRRAITRQLNRTLDDATVPPAELLRSVVTEYTFGLALIEIEAWATRVGQDTAAVIRLEGDIKSYLDRVVQKLDLTDAVLVTSSQFKHASREILRALLAVLPGEVKDQ